MSDRIWYQPNGHVNRISARSDKERNRYEGQFPYSEPYFATWEEAHDWMMAKIRSHIERHKKELKAAQRRMAKAMQMQKPRNAND